MFKQAALFPALALLYAAFPAWGFHTLDCGPFRAAVVDENTGVKKCVARSEDARRQFQRFRALQQEQEKRIRDLELQQNQQAKKQDLIQKQEKNKQQQFSRQQTARQKQPALSLERSSNLLDQLKRQELDATKRREQQRADDLFRQGNLLEQKIELPRADLLDGQKSLNRRLKKDQSEN